MTRLPILCYHKVGPVALEGRRLNIEPRRLDQHVRFFMRRGFRFVCARDLINVWPARAVCLTFDDAYHSAVTWGREVLNRHQVLASFYAVSSLVGHSSLWDGEQARPLARWELLKEAQAEGHEIGNHTSSHADLSRLDLGSQVKEIEAADDAFLHHGISDETLCYPYGRVNASTPEAASLAGYKLGLALGKRVASELENRLLLPRIVMAYSDATPKLLYKMHIRPLMLRKR